MSVLDTFSLKGKVVLVTGASSGIGRAIAVACAEAGATVAAVARDAARLEDLLVDLRKINDKNHVVKSVDITEFEKIPGTVAEIVAQCGAVSGFVHAAGIAPTCPLRVTNPETYKKVYDVNVVAGFEFAKALSGKRNLAAPASFLFIASISAKKGIAGLIAYSSSKGAVIAGMQSMAAELWHKGIRVNVLLPGHIVDTQMGAETLSTLPADSVEHLKTQHPLGLGNSSALTGAAVYFLSESSWWVTGTSLVVDGGYCL